MGLESAIPGVGFALGIGGAIGKLFGNAKANRGLRRLQASDPSYTQNPLARQRLDLANTLLNARMPGSAQQERNIYATGANQMGNISRNATDSSQALALGAANVGQQNQAFNQLGLDETQDYQRRYGNVVNAQDAVINEGDKAYQDEVRRFGDRAQIGGAMNANRQNTWGSISNLGFGLADFGINGGFSGMFGNGNGRANKWSPPREGFNSAGYATGTF